MQLSDEDELGKYSRVVGSSFNTVAIVLIGYAYDVSPLRNAIPHPVACEIGDRLTCNHMLYSGRGDRANGVGESQVSDGA